MNKFCVFLCIFGFLVSAPRAEACRCKPQPLTTYFEHSDYVFLAKVISVKEVSDQNTKQKKLNFRALSDFFKGKADEIRHLATPSSSATCGLQVKNGSEYLMFAVRDTEKPGTAMVHTCTGAREFKASAPEQSMGFVDYPAEQVLKALQVLKTSEHFQQNGMGGVPKTDSVIGLLEMREENGAQTNLTVRSAPDDSAKTLFIIDSIKQVQSKEVSYENPAAVVFERDGSWSRVQRVEGGHGWVKDSSHLSFHPLDTLLVNRLSYLTKHWDGFLWPNPGAGNPFTISRLKGSELPVVIEQFEKVADSLWIKVKIYKVSPCEGGDDAEFTNVGWVPAWSAAGQLSVWFWSRGC